MEENQKPIKISLTGLLIIAIIIIALVIAIAVSLALFRNNSKKDIATNTTFNNSGTKVRNTFSKNTTSNNAVSKPVTRKDYVCTIIGKNSKLLFRNEYETDNTFNTKVIYLDENLRNEMYEEISDIQQILYIGTFSGEFISVRYDDSFDDFGFIQAYAEDKGFYNCVTNAFVRKTFDYDGTEIEFPKFNYDGDDYTEVLEEYENFVRSIPKMYAMFDIITEEGNNYIVGMYSQRFQDNENGLSIIIVLKKDNVNIDFENEEEVNSFWNNYTNFEVVPNEQFKEAKYEEIDIRGEIYYHLLTTDSWEGNYHQDNYYTGEKTDFTKVVSYEDYVAYIEELNSLITSEKIQPTYYDRNSNYLIMSYSNGFSWCSMKLIDYVEEDGKVIIYGQESINGVMADGSGFLVVIPTNMPVDTEINYRECYTTEEISNLQNYNSTQTYVTIDKPIIYLYPVKDTKINVKLVNDDLLTCVYPKYNKEGWNVLAKPNGELIDLSTNRELYSLYYESKAKVEPTVTNEGFVVKGEDSANFLEEKLSILGLTEREAEEFIVYWLPKLEANKYNYIRFETIEEIEENMPLEITPKPDSTIRVMMVFKGLEKTIKINEQILNSPTREGFKVVEWGGSEIK